MLVHLLDPEALTDRRAQLQPEAGIFLSCDKDTFQRLAIEANSLVLEGCGSSVPEWTLVWRARHPVVPPLFVTDTKPPEAIERRLMAARVRRERECKEAFGAALQQAKLFGTIHLWAEILGRSSPFPTPLQKALARAVRAEERVTVSRTVQWTDLHRSTVARHWRRGVGPDGPSLKLFTDGLLVLHALVHRWDGSTWESVARRIGVSARTLRAAAHRSLDCSLGELQRMNTNRLTSKVKEKCAPFLCR